jgi:predicted ATPase/DNA-binding CsgD family transcriptional regulator
MTEARLPVEAGVSDREAEVLALVGDHLTNAQIASRLYISVRTVESHVSSLLRKLDVADRRALAQYAAEPPATAESAGAAVTDLPTPLTSFVGRMAERAALAHAVAVHRLVTGVGPGGVGKTRLALAVAEDVSVDYSGGARYVDLVPVTDPAMVGAALAAACGFGEQPGRTPTDTVIAKLADAEVLVVMDNCEHLLDGVSALLGRLLTSCPGATVLATSRARLQLPFEYVFHVPGLSLGAEAGEGDATTLFCERAAMAGWSSPYPEDRRRISTICGRLDGVALAIELAAARVATIGLDGLVRGLTNPLVMLTGGPRLDERHRSLRSALDWSFGLLDEKDQVVMRRASVFAAPFAPAAVVAVAGHAPLMPGEVPAGLARLADHSLLEVVAGPGGTRYRMLETVRQYATERMAEAGDGTETRRHHLRWCLATAATLQEDAETSTAFDEVADDLRTALGWAAGQPRFRAEAHELAVRLAELTFARGLPSETQRRYDEAAVLAADPAEAAAALHLAATVAWGRHAGNDAMRLYRAASDAARAAGDAQRAAIELATLAHLMELAPGVMSELPPRGEVTRLLAEARTLTDGGNTYIEATALMLAVCAPERDPVSPELAERAVELARRVGDARLRAAALDQLTAVRLAQGDLDAAAATVRRRIELLAPRARDVELAWEYPDALHMAPMVYLAAGDLEAARHYARQRSEIPFFRGADHLAVTWMLTTAALAGDFDEAVRLAQRFHRSWVEAGRPTIGGVAFAPAAASMVHGIRGDDDARREWLGIVTEMRRATASRVGHNTGYSEFLDAMASLHRGELDNALARLAAGPDSLRRWDNRTWRQWYAAVWAEAGVLAEQADRDDRLALARLIAARNPIAEAIVDRAEALGAGDTERLLATAAALEAAGCRYQYARTLVFAGGEARAEGEQILSAIGAAPMAAGGRGANAPPA